MNYEPVTIGNQTNDDAGIETNVNAGHTRQEKASDHEYILLPLMLFNSLLSSSSQSTDNKDVDEVPGKGDDDLTELDNFLVQQKEGHANNTNRAFTVNPSVSAAGQGFDNADDQERVNSSTQDVNTVGPSINTACKNVNIGSSNINIASPIPNDPSMKSLEATDILMMHMMVEKKWVQKLTSTTCWIEAMQEEFLQFKLQKVWTLVDLPKGKRAVGTKWVYRNKKDERGIVVRNKVRLVAQGYTQEEGINYDEVFAPVARIEAIRLFLAYASFMGLIVYQMDVKSVFLYGTIKKEVYVCQPLSFEDPQFPDKVYKVKKLYMVYIKLLEPGMRPLLAVYLLK
ncbi:putative ribonuclease H-like domain-containing protein [Tanacetum coccineum]